MEITNTSKESLKAFRKERFMLMLKAGAIIALVNLILAYSQWAFNFSINATISSIINLSTFAVVFVWLGKAESLLMGQYYPGEGYGYGKALGTAVVASLISGVFSAIGLWVLYTFIAPQYVQEIMNIALQSLPEAQQTDQTIMIVKMIVGFSTSFMGLLTFGCIGQALVGLFVSLFTSITVKKEPSITE